MDGMLIVDGSSSAEKGLYVASICETGSALFDMDLERSSNSAINSVCLVVS